jgi:hypothetical protein
MHRWSAVSFFLALSGVVIAFFQLNASAEAWIVSKWLTATEAVDWVTGSLGMNREGRWAVFLMMFFVGWVLGELVNWNARRIVAGSRIPLVGAALVLMGHGGAILKDAA